MGYLADAISSQVQQDQNLIDRPEWHGRAACGRNGVCGDSPTARIQMFFPGRGAPDYQAALRVCKGCPVQVECKESIRDTNISYGRTVGIWAGTTGADRRTTTTRWCRQCDEEFDSPNLHIRFCSQECRAQRQREIQAASTRRDRA